MNLRFLTLASLLTASTFAADAPKLPSVAAAKEKQMSGELRKPAEPTAKKKELLFSDDFERAELGKDKGWAIVVPTFSVENGTLKGTQMRFEVRRRRAYGIGGINGKIRQPDQAYCLTF